jgi:hypothetical protein
VDKNDLTQVVQKLTASLAPALWLDENHLKVPPQGNKVFDSEKAAVHILMDEITDSNSLIADATLQALIDQIVQVDQGLAGVELNEAIAGGGNAGKIADAQDEMANAAGDLTKGDFDGAIDHFKKAWSKAEQA